MYYNVGVGALAYDWNENQASGYRREIDALSHDGWQ